MINEILGEHSCEIGTRGETRLGDIAVTPPGTFQMGHRNEI